MALMSGSLLTFPVESEDSEALESFLATGRAVQRRKEARAPLSSASHSSALTHICFSPMSANRLKLTFSSPQMTQYFSLHFFRGYKSKQFLFTVLVNDKILNINQTYSNKNMGEKTEERRNSLLEF